MKGMVMTQQESKSKLEELEFATRRWSMIMGYAREAVSLEDATSMEAKNRRKLEKRMTLFQSELAKLPDIERLRLSTMLSATLVRELADMHVAIVSLNGQHQVGRTTTPEARRAADEQAKQALDDVIELYAI